jgi:hypothetical protein
MLNELKQGHHPPPLYIPRCTCLVHRGNKEEEEEEEEGGDMEFAILAVCRNQSISREFLIFYTVRYFINIQHIAVVSNCSSIIKNEMENLGC